MEKTYEIVIRNVVTGKEEALKKMPTDKATLTEMANRLNAMGGDLRAYVRLVMNEHERQIARLVKRAISEYIGGFENSMLDFKEGDEEYEDAKAFLGNHNLIVDTIYSDIMSESRSNYRSHLRFAGKETIMEIIENAVVKAGY